MAFFYYRQNNPGGKTYNNHIVGSWVIVEHIDAEWANDFVQECTGGAVYFNGCSNNIDCKCCGDRWWRVNKAGFYGEDEDGKEPLLPFFRGSNPVKPEGDLFVIEDILGKEVEISFGPYKDDLIHVYMKDGEHRIYSYGKTENGRYVFNRQM